MIRRHSLLLTAVALLALSVWGCEGDRGPEGPPGPAGPAGGTGEFSFVGNNGESCLHCHGTTVATVMLTGHTEAYDDLEAEDQEHLYCLQCHTTGWDSEVGFADTEIAVYGPDVNGYDDYYGVEGDEAAERREALEGVQCESCHGPMGPDFNSHTPDISFATRFEGEVSLSLCSPCHNGQLEEWGVSGHGQFGTGDIEEYNDEFARNPCRGCHTSEGYIQRMDPAYADYEFPEEESFIGCVTCHDPHKGEAGGGNFAQLRNVGPVEVEYHPGYDDGDPEVATMDGYGPAQTCAQCHHARRDTDNVEGQIADGYDHFGPHGSPQMDMFIGNGSYEIRDKTYTRNHAHQGIDIACVQCHMEREAEIHGELQNHAFHNFMPDTGGCVSCHGNLPDFDYNGLQTEIASKLEDIAVGLGYADAADLEANWDDDNVNPAVEVWKREAAYAFFFVANDGSHGVHNPNYATTLLDNALEYIGENTIAPGLSMK